MVSTFPRYKPINLTQEINTVSSCKYQLFSVRHTDSHMYKNKQAFWRTRPHSLLVSSTHPANAAKAAKLQVRALQKQRTDRLADLQIQNSSTRITCKINTMAQLSDDFQSSRDHFPGSTVPFVKAAPQVSVEGKQLSTSVKEYSV